MEQGLRLSIIMPAFNEEERLTDSLEKVARFIGEQKYRAQVILVDNASTDSTGDIARAFSERYPYVLYVYQPVRGKGAAVKSGMLNAEGEYLLICDADLAVPIEEANKSLALAVQSYDVIIGSREAPGAVRYDEPQYRHIMGRVFNLFTRMLLLPGIRDTQCGFKMFRRETAQRLFRKLETYGWGFDVEILYRARLAGCSMVEIPVIWYYRKSSKINPFRDSLHMFAEIVKIWSKRRTFIDSDTFRRKSDID